MALSFLKKKTRPIVYGKGYIPVDRVKEMASRGLTEPEIIDVLRREGFSVDEIDKALTQALRLDITQSKEKTESKEEPKLPTLSDINVEKRTPIEIPETSLPESYYQESYDIEDYIDYLLQLKSEEIEETLGEFDDKLKKISERLDTLSEKVNQLVSSGGLKQKELFDKIEELNKGFNDLNVRLSGLEKVFKETLPVILESVRSISNVVQKIKKLPK
jgi:DNA-binding transcriptional MerR regulator